MKFLGSAWVVAGRRAGRREPRIERKRGGQKVARARARARARVKVRVRVR